MFSPKFCSRVCLKRISQLQEFNEFLRKARKTERNNDRDRTRKKSVIKRESVRVCVCVYLWMCVCMCVRVCVGEREIEKRECVWEIEKKKDDRKKEKSLKLSKTAKTNDYTLLFPLFQDLAEDGIRNWASRATSPWSTATGPSNPIRPSQPGSPWVTPGWVDSHARQTLNSGEDSVVEVQAVTEVEAVEVILVSHFHILVQDKSSSDL